jgi:hypothetical protein
MVGSAAALGPDDIITCQYRETGVFLQRGFTLKDFMSQLVHNKNDPGKGRNMPCHYSGKIKTGVVSMNRVSLFGTPRILIEAARSRIDSGNANTTCYGSCLCPETGR